MLEGMRVILDFLAVVLCVVEVFQLKLTKKKIRWIVAIPFLIGIFVISGFYENNMLRLPFMLLFMTITYMGLLCGPWMKKITIYLFSIFNLHIIYLLVELLVKALGFYCPKILYIAELVESSLVIICIMIFSHIIKKNKNWPKWLEKISAKYYFFGFLCSFAASGIATFVDTQIKYSSPKIRITVMILVIIVSAFLYMMGIGLLFVNSLRQYYKEECIQKDEYLRLSRLHYKSLMENMKEVRKMRHDMKAHLSAMSYLTETKDWKKLSSYLEKTGGEIYSRGGRMIDVNHDLVNAILSESIGREKDLSFQYEGYLPDDIKIDDYDLCTIFSNLISNSIEACEQLEGIEKRIVLCIKIFQNNLYIRIENPVQKDVELKEIGKKTSKGDKVNHGYGIQNIITAVEKYQGEVEFRCENKIFSVEIIFVDILD